MGGDSNFGISQIQQGQKFFLRIRSVPADGQPFRPRNYLRKLISILKITDRYRAGRLAPT